MIKEAVLLLHFLGLFLFQLFFPAGVTVEQNTPATAEPGEEFTVEITINKGDVSGFAKVQQILPEGFTASAGNSQGATFSYSERKVKFIWMALPGDSEFTITYNIQVPEDYNGNFSLDGKFAYIKDNERMESDIPASEITVGAGEQMAEEQKGTESEEETADSEEETQEDDGGTADADEGTEEEQDDEVAEETESTDDSGESGDEEETTTPATEMADVKISRSVEEEVPGTFIVTLTVDKENVSGFAKIEEQLPDGFAAYEVESEEGIFSYNENERIAKILWMSLPSASVYEVKYKVVAETAGSGDYELSGGFSYLENEESHKAVVNPTSFSYEGQTMTANEEDTETEGDEDDGKTTASGDNDNMRTSGDEEEDSGDEEQLTEEDVTSVPSPDKGVDYKVQVAASHKVVPDDYFRKKYSLTTSVSMIRHKGWNKYLTGEYPIYKKARDRRNEIWNTTDINDAFVTAYNDGNRITVQEALMITNQEWVK